MAVTYTIASSDEGKLRAVVYDSQTLEIFAERAFGTSAELLRWLEAELRRRGYESLSSPRQ